MRQIALFLGMFLLAPLAHLAAQESLTLAPGARVRVSIRQQGRQTGSLVALKADTLIVKAEKRTAPSAILLSSITKLEFSKGHKRSAGKGAGLGFLIGAGVGVIAGTIAAQSYSGYDTETDWYWYQTAPVFGGGCGILGALVGGFVGADAERWEPVPLPVRLSVAPQRGGGVRLAASFSF